MLVEQIKNREFLEESIKNLKKENPSADIQLLEKTIGALFLVEILVSTGLDFIFKGGTSLILLLDEIKRFSVDVDIITEESQEKVKQTISEIIDNQDLFTRVEENIRENSVSKRMEIAHYKFFFNSVTDDSEKYILLDIAFESNQYPGVIEKRIENTKLNVKSNLSVKVPSIVGMRKFTNFMLERKFLIDKEVLTAASKVAYLVYLIKNNKNEIERYGIGNIEGIEIPIEYRKRLKVIQKINEEAYYYIVKSIGH